jgi:hypothetical protein
LNRSGEHKTCHGKLFQVPRATSKTASNDLSKTKILTGKYDGGLFGKSRMIEKLARRNKTGKIVWLVTGVLFLD